MTFRGHVVLIFVARVVSFAPEQIILLGPQSALPLWACALLLVFEKFTHAYLFQIALEIK